ncbi:hypothetical protein ACFQ51_56910 [Streptomyces kaempferi]
MLATRTSSDPTVAARVTADLHGLPTGRLTARDTAAHIFTADIHELRAWINALGGFVTRQRAAAPSPSGRSTPTPSPAPTARAPRSSSTPCPSLASASTRTSPKPLRNDPAPTP